MRRTRWVWVVAFGLAIWGPDTVCDSGPPLPEAWVLVLDLATAEGRVVAREVEGALVDRAIQAISDRAVRDGWTCDRESSLGGVELVRAGVRWVVVVGEARAGWLRALAWRCDANDESHSTGGAGR